MIYDSLQHADQYKLGPAFDRAFEYLRSDRAKTDPLGRHDLDGDRLYVSVQQYDTRPPERCKWEAHRRYADVQYLVTGHEHIAVAPIARMTVVDPYEEQRDAAFFDGEGTLHALGDGMFLVLLPQDVHRPGLTIDKPQQVRKVVVKVLLEG